MRYDMFGYNFDKDDMAAFNQALAAADASLPPQVRLGDNPRERMLYRVIDRYLARRGEERIDELGEDTIDELAALFEATERDIQAQDAESGL